MKRRVFLACALAIGTTGCTIGRGAPDLAHYDLGTDPPPQSERGVGFSLALDDVTGAGWLQTSGILYRLTYRDAARLQAYSLSRWTAPPTALLTQRLRAALSGSAERGVAMVADGVPTDRVLKVVLEAFEQRVQSPTSSAAVIAMRALLLDGRTRSLVGQRSLRIVEPCSSVDAVGAVLALRAASDRAIGELIAWLAVDARNA